MATPPSKPTVKEQRAAKRAAQVEEFKRREAARRRTRLIAIVAGVAAGVLVLGGATTALVLSSIPPEVEVGEGPLADRVELYPDLDATHTESRVGYDVEPPVGGPHNPAWLNCGVYDEPQQNEYAVHSLEHGAVWFAYDPAFATDAQIDGMRAIADDLGGYVLVTPYPGIGDALAVSAWGAQLRFADVDDPAVAEFVETYWRAASAPEPMATCSGAIEGPGRVS